MKRHNQILAGILALQIVLSVVVLWPRSAATGESEAVLPDLKAEDIVGLTITDANGDSIALRQVTGNWVLPNADDYPARADTVTAFLDKLVGLTTARLVTRTTASHKQLQVSADDFVRRIDLEISGGKKNTLYLGSFPAYGATHFRVDGQGEIYLTDAISTWETNVTFATWIDTSYVDIPQADISKMTLENANGKFTFTQDSEGNWAMEGLAADETLDQTNLESLVWQATSVSIKSPLGKQDLPGYGMDAPGAVVTLETADRTITLRVGAQDPTDSSYVVISSESAYYVQVSEYNVKDLVEKTREDFLPLPPTPTPEESTDTSR